MKNLKNLAPFILLLFSLTSFSQQRPAGPKIIVTGSIIEAVSQKPLEYATITLKNAANPKMVFGGITDNKGNFSVEIAAGTYDIIFEFISFKSSEIKQKEITSNTNLGKITLAEDVTQLNEVVVRAERTTVEIKLDKKVYNVGKDLMVKGGTVSDILDNIPSVTVDVDGTIALRGNDNVRILIDGKPSTAINVSDALRLIPADAIDRVEVITNPSARYDAEGGGGLLNIILKKGKTNGLNGTFIANTGFPDNHGITGNVNYKTNDVNFFTNQGFSNRNSPGFNNVDTEYLSPSPTSPLFISERRNNNRYSNSYNGGFGMEWFINDNTSWTNSVNYRNSEGANITDATFTNIFANNSTLIRTRDNRDTNNEESIEYNSNFLMKFKRDGHKLNVDYQSSFNRENSESIIFDSQFPNAASFNDQTQNRNLIATDYVLPFGKGMQFEAGYRGEFTVQRTNVAIFEDNVSLEDLSNIVEYREFVNALYTQFGFKKNKFSFLFGLRWEDSNIEVNLLDQNNFNDKKYNNFFPSSFVTYQINEESSTSLSYSKRIRRPRGRFLNPSSDFSSNINIFQGNPDLDPALTDAIDIGYLTKFGSKITFNTSIYGNRTNDVFNFVRKESGEFTSDGIPIILFSPVNVATEYRLGFELNTNYTPFKWWRLNYNFNFFSIETQGEFRYIDFNDNPVVQNLDNKATSWSTRLTSKITLPYKIDWQTNMNYEGRQRNAQGLRRGIFGANIALSKDVLKDKGTIAFNVSDVFNSRIRGVETFLPGAIDSFSEFQWRVRQYTLSFTYRFNKAKNERERRPRNFQEDGGDFPG
ncbi:outer membrane beta-barrel family protein [Flavobacterium sp. j3]|uniref:Outer membrane beta-barrel family protein n=1 Tax=Flavobacterium aureirubrum TaxID=3133147 RepID=A0ABU9N7Z7_9FLAO